MAESASLVEQGKKLIAQEKIFDALICFSDALKKNPQDADALYCLIESQICSNDLKFARSMLEQAFTDYPNQPRTYIVNGLYLMQLCQYEKAINSFNRALELEPNNFTTLYNKGLCYRHLHHLEEATQCILQSLSINPKFPRAHFELSQIFGLAGRPNEQCMESWAAIACDPTFAPAYGQIAQMFELGGGQYDNAITIYQLAIKFCPKNEFFHAQLAKLLAFKGRYDEAIEITKQLMQLREAYIDRLMLGQMYFMKHDDKSAQGIFQKAIEMYPNFWESYYNLALVSESLNDFKQALNLYQKAIKISGDQDFRPYNDGGLLMMMRFNQGEEAEKYFQKALQIAPDHIEPRYNLALYYSHKSDKEKAKQYINEVLQKTKPDEKAHQSAQNLLEALEGNPIIR